MRIPLPIAVAATVLAAGAAGIVVAARMDESDARWRVVRSEPTSSVVVIQSQHGACTPFTRTSVRETGNEVRITVHQHERPFWSNGACDDNLVISCHRIRLDRERGSRTVTGPKMYSLDAPDVDDKLGACP